MHSVIARHMRATKDFINPGYHNSVLCELHSCKIDVHECLIYKKNRSSGLQNHCMATTLWIETSSAYDGVIANYCY